MVLNRKSQSLPESRSLTLEHGCDRLIKEAEFAPDNGWIETEMKGVRRRFILARRAARSIGRVPTLRRRLDDSSSRCRSNSCN
jgi:hypothetical protein